MQAAALTEHIARSGGDNTDRFPSKEYSMASRGGRSPANITKHLKGISFPAKQPDLVKHAREQKAEREVIEVLENLPDRDYGNMADVMKAMGEAE